MFELTDPLVIYGAFIIGCFLILFSVVLLFAVRKQLLVDVSLDTDLLMIVVPKEATEKEEEGKKDIKEVVGFAEQMFSNLYSIAKPTKNPFKLPKYVTFEIAAFGGKIIFYVSSPKKRTPLVEKIIHAQYPKAKIEKVKDYNIFSPDSVGYGLELKLENPTFLPIKTYKYLETDPLSALSNSLSKMSKGEGSAIQIVVQPAHRSWSKGGPKAAKLMVRKGFDLKQATSGRARFAKQFGETMKDARESLRREPKPQSSMDDRKDLTPVEQDVVKVVEEKSGKLGFYTTIRIVASAASREAAEMHAENILSSFTQFSSPQVNSFEIAKKGKRSILRDFIFRRPAKKNKKLILNTEELASIFHLPTRATETPNVEALLSKQAAAPTNIPTEGILLGENNYRGVTREIRFNKKDRARHFYAIGTTGSGKTTILQNMAAQDVENGDGFCIIDPHGDFIEEILGIIPKERAEDVVLFNPADLDRPVGLNILEWDPKFPEQKDFMVNEMIAIFQKLFPPEMIGPMFEHQMRNVMLTLMSDTDDPGTIVEIPRMFTDDDFAKSKLKFVDDPIVRDFWEKEMAKTNDFHKSEMLGYLVSKVGQFIENTMMRNIIGQQRSGVDFRDIINNKKILLCNLSKGKIGDINSSLLGLILVSKLQVAAFERAAMPESERKDFYVYMDEFQNFVTPTIATILSEARKYKLILNLAHQYIAQLSTEKSSEVRDAVFGNVGTMCVYRVGATDAEFLEKEFHPTFTQSDLIHTERYHANVKLMIDGTVSEPFTMKAFPPKEGDDPKRKEAIRQIARLKCGKPREIVEKDIERRIKAAGTAPLQDKVPPSL